MIFPDHCRLVGVRERLDGALTPRVGERVYFSSHYLIVFQHERAALYEITSEGRGLLRTITKANKIAGFDETAVYKRKVDIFNRGELIQKAHRLCKGSIKAVVFQGLDLHWTFVYEPDRTAITEIEVFDMAPPDPAYLVNLIKKLDNAGVFGDLCVSFKPIIYDLRTAHNATIYPCSASGIGANYLNERDLNVEQENILLGCDVSRQVLEERCGGVSFDHVNICPTKSVQPHKPFITKCCKSARVGPTELCGQKGYVVHWGANPYEVAAAIRALVESL
ncbi:MAG: DUF7714 family protein [Halobacteriota archaeon]